MKIKKTLTSNGVRIFCVENNNLDSVSIHFGFGVGSRLEEKKYSGISHFLEHMTFKGSKKYSSQKKISRALDSIGALNNAETDKEYTQYYARVLPQYFSLALDILADTSLNPLIEATELEKERGTVIEEINLYESNPMMNIISKAEGSLWGNNSLGWDIVGSFDSVKNITSQVMHSYHKENYTAKNLSIIIYGKLPKDYLNLTNRIAKSVTVGKKSTWSLPNPNNIKGHLSFKKSEQTMLALSVPTFDIASPKRVASKMLSMILGGYSSSRLFTEIREKRGWAYAVSAMSIPYTDTGIFSIVGGIKNDKVEDSFWLITDELLGITATVTDEEIERARGCLLGARKLNLENPDIMANFLTLRSILAGEPELPEVEFNEIEKITKEEIVAAAKEIFQKEKIRYAIIGPFKDSEKFDKILG